MLGKIELLEKLPVFQGLSKAQLGTIVEACEKVFFKAGENLIVKGERGDTAFVIMTGTARCLHFPGTPSPDGPAGPGSLVGELSMLSETVHALSIRASERVRALAIRRDALKRVMEADAAIAQQISENLLTRLSNIARDLRRLDGFLSHLEGSETDRPSGLSATEAPSFSPPRRPAANTRT